MFNNISDFDVVALDVGLLADLILGEVFVSELLSVAAGVGSWCNWWGETERTRGVVGTAQRSLGLCVSRFLSCRLCAYALFFLPFFPLPRLCCLGGAFIFFFVCVGWASSGGSFKCQEGHR